LLLLIAKKATNVLPLNVKASWVTILKAAHVTWAIRLAQPAQKRPSPVVNADGKTDMQKPEKQFIVSGYAAIFDHIDLSKDRFIIGAFRNVDIDQRPIPMLHQHRSLHPIGKWSSIKEDNTGLHVSGIVTDRAVRRLIIAGIDGLSVGFRAHHYTISKHIRTISLVDLVEISIVRNPMQRICCLTYSEDIYSG